jgi:DNA-binding FrmR family transcriptional regulator
MESANFEVLNKNVLNLMKDVAIIKEHLEDCFLTAEEEANLDKALEELERGETTSLEDLKKELGL